MVIIKVERDFELWKELRLNFKRVYGIRISWVEVWLVRKFYWE